MPKKETWLCLKNGAGHPDPTRENMKKITIIVELLLLSSCTPVQMARYNCTNGDQSACIDYMAYTHAGMPGTAASYIQQQRAAGLAPSPYDRNEVPVAQGTPVTQQLPYATVPYDPNTNF